MQRDWSNAMNTPQMSIEELLDTILLDESAPTYEALLKWCERHPQYREELARFFATWGVQENISYDVEIDEDRLASLGVSQALNLLETRQEQQTHKSAHSRDGTRLLSWAGRIGISEEVLARKTRLDHVILKKLDLRRLTGVPQQCLERLAMALQSSIDFLRLLITGPPVLQEGVRYKSRKRPKLTTEDFADAVRNSSLDDADKRYWLGAIEKDREAQRR